MYRDINGKTGVTKMQGTTTLWGNIAYMKRDGDLSFLADGITEEPDPVQPTPDPAKQLEKARSNKIRYIDETYYYAREEVNVTANIGGTDYEFQCGPRSTRLVNDTVTAHSLTNVLPPFWKTADNQKAPIAGIDDLKAIVMAIQTREMETFGTRTALKELAEAAVDQAALDAIEWPWPGGVDPRVDQPIN